MKIYSLRIQNFRSFEDETIYFNDYTCLVGSNGSGKSNVICAMNVLFGETEGATTDLRTLSIEDFHKKNKENPIVITMTFVDLSEAAKTDFADYFRQDKLVISAVAVFDSVSQNAPVKQFGQRMGMAAFKEYFKAKGDKKPTGELKPIYANIKVTIPDLPNTSTEPGMTSALRQYESDNPELCVLIPSEDQFYGISKGTNLLTKYVQWVFVPAVKEITEEQKESKNTVLGKLVARTVRAKVNFADKIKEIREVAQRGYQELISSNQNALNDISTSLQNRLAEWSHPEAILKLTWDQDEKSVKIDEPYAKIIAGEGLFEGDLTRFGNGFQRSYFLALLQELSGSDDPDAPKLIIACKEPELFQHPPQARHLYNVFQTLSDANSQVIVCSHSPYFVSGERFEDIRIVRKSNSTSRVKHVTFDQIGSMLSSAGGKAAKRDGTLAKLNQELQPSLNEMFFSTHLVLVEGLEDFAYITTYISLMRLDGEFRSLGCHIVPVNGKSNFARPIALAKLLEIPTFVVFDADSDKLTKHEYRTKHEKDNTLILKLWGVANPEPFPASIFIADSLTMWSTDVGKSIETDIGSTELEKYSNKADTLYGSAGGLKKNSLHIAASLTFAWEDGVKSDSLEALCNRILEFARERNI